MAIGLIGAAGAAVTGITDWQDIDPPARRIGLVHGVLNVASVGLFAGSLLQDAEAGSRSTGRSLAALGCRRSRLLRLAWAEVWFMNTKWDGPYCFGKITRRFMTVLSESN